MIWMNKQAQELVLEPLGLDIEDYLGKTDVDFWEGEFAKQFAKTDNKVIRTKKPLEVIHSFLDVNREEIKAMVLKYPRMQNNDVIGVGGLIKYIIDDERTKT